MEKNYTTKELKTKKLLSKKRFSRVIFQDHSNYPLTAIDTTAKYLGKLQSIAKKTNKKYIYSKNNPKLWCFSVII